MPEEAIVILSLSCSHTNLDATLSNSYYTTNYQIIISMRLSAGFSLALLGTATNIACGFSLKPSLSTKNYVNTHIALQKNDLQIRGHSPSSTGMFQNQFYKMNVVKNVRGGASAAEVSNFEGQSSSSGLGNKVASLWGAAGVVMILAKSIKRVLPIALEPFAEGSVPLSQFQLG